MICGLPVLRRLKYRLQFIALFGALALAGCEVGPDYHRPATATPEQWKAQAPWKEAQPREAEIRENFWELYNDPILDGLEIQATTNNPDITAALARVDEARAVARISRADLMPSVNSYSYWYRTRYSPNRPLVPGAAQEAYTANDYVLPLDLSYEIDLWGRVRRSFRAARNQAQASAADYQNVLLSLRADVAMTYFGIRALDGDRKILRDTIALRRKNLDLVKSLHEGGADSAVDVARAETELDSAEADLFGYDLRRAQLENALAAYCGLSASGFSLAELDHPYQTPIPHVPAGLPADMLERRPDVAEAERNMAAANENIGVAKAAFFPAVRLTAAAGVESAELKNVFDWESRFWSFGPSVDLPIFEGGRNRAGLAQSRAAYDEAVAKYRSQILVAFHEVEDGLVGMRLLQDQLEAQNRAVRAAGQAADLSRTRYKEGLVSYFEVVDAERTLLDNQLAADDLMGQSLGTSVLLIKALGGGWRPDQGFVSGTVAPVQKSGAGGQ